MKKVKCTICLFLVFVLTIASTGQQDTQAKKKKAKLSKTKLTLYVGKTAKLKVKNNKKKIKWSSSKKKVAMVSKKGKVTAKQKGKAVITAKIGKKKLKCKVTVKEKIVYKTQMIENFESYAPGTDWGNYTLGEGLTSGGDEDPHYLAKDETMKVVVDPENPNNKVLQVKPKFYSYAPVFTVDLTKLTGLSTKKLGDYAGVRVKIRVVSDASCHVGIGLNAFFGKAGTINKKYAFNTYTASDQALPKEVEYYKFYYAKGMLTGVGPEDGSMPQFTAGKHTKGHKFLEKDKNVGFATKTLTFNKYLTSTLKQQNQFDFVLGGSYSKPLKGEYLAWYMDDVQLIYR
ncbi:MAG: Ig-like domain-containing protein [Lachnospiraceae bacterium]|nr:Ig-like domain-containing protein [Lachnospiraceae bacterium]